MIRGKDIAHSKDIARNYADIFNWKNIQIVEQKFDIAELFLLNQRNFAKFPEM